MIKVAAFIPLPPVQWEMFAVHIFSHFIFATQLLRGSWVCLWTQTQKTQFDSRKRGAQHKAAGRDLSTCQSSGTLKRKGLRSGLSHQNGELPGYSLFYFLSPGRASWACLVVFILSDSLHLHRFVSLSAVQPQVGRSRALHSAPCCFRCPPGR